LINSLFANGNGNGKLWVGIVPFSQAVNVGTSHTGWLDTTFDNNIPNLTVTVPSPNQVVTGPGWGGTTWAGCVDARANGYDITDDPPSSGNSNTLFRQYYWPTDNLTYQSSINNTPNSDSNDWAQPTYNRCKNGSCTTVTGSCSTNNGRTCTYTGFTYSSPLNTTAQGPNYLCPSAVTPMTNVSSTLTSAISGMSAQGNTLINQGLQWGWNMISPRWRGQWGGTMSANALPLDYGSSGMNKAVILMTDGFNTIDDGSHSSYWFLHNGLTGSTSSSGAVSNLNTKTSQLCTAMKNKGIYIYTIALGTDVNAAAISLLQNCATAPNYFFNSPSTSQLQGIFNAISDSLANLRVSH
jgi:hypothetical protein